MLYFDHAHETELCDRCIRPLCFAADGDEHYGLEMFELIAGVRVKSAIMTLGLQGTCTLIRYRGQHFVIFTRHQIAEIPSEKIEDFQKRMGMLFVLMDDGRDTTNLPLHSLLFSFEHLENDDDDDFVVAVIESSMLTEFMRAQFFPVERGPNGLVGDHALGAGFPSYMQRVLMERNGLMNKAMCKSGQITSRTGGSTAVMAYGRDDEVLDGVSGGAVFVLKSIMKAANCVIFVAFIDGIIQRGGGGVLRYLTIERVLDRIDRSTYGSA